MGLASCVLGRKPYRCACLKITSMTLRIFTRLGFDSSFSLPSCRNQFCTSMDPCRWPVPSPNAAKHAAGCSGDKFQSSGTPSESRLRTGHPRVPPGCSLWPILRKLLVWLLYSQKHWDRTPWSAVAPRLLLSSLTPLPCPRQSSRLLAHHRRGSYSTCTRICPQTCGTKHGCSRVDSVSVPSSAVTA